MCCLSLSQETPAVCPPGLTTIELPWPGLTVVSMWVPSSSLQLLVQSGCAGVWGPPSPTPGSSSKVTGRPGVREPQPWPQTMSFLTLADAPTQSCVLPLLSAINGSHKPSRRVKHSLVQRLICPDESHTLAARQNSQAGTPVSTSHFICPRAFSHSGSEVE